MPNQGVSVVMAVYNGERFLADAVTSVLEQTMPDLELIVVDDGSTDSTPGILQRYAAADRRVRVVQAQHGGVPRAVNTGIREARYEWIARTDSDDRMLPHRLERQLAFLDQHPELAVAASGCYFINAAGKRIGSFSHAVDVERARRELRPACFVEITQSTVLMKKAAVLEAGGYRDFSYAEDRDLWGRLATAGYAMACQPEFLVEYRLHGGSMTMNDAFRQHELCSFIDYNIVRRWQRLPETSLDEYRTWKQGQGLKGRVSEMLNLGALHAFKRASRHYGEGRYCRCALTLAAAFSLNPGHIAGRVLSRVREARA
jgi:alpha-1,3-rhamnosyltransferase